MSDISVAPAVVEVPATTTAPVEAAAPAKKPSSGMAWRKPASDTPATIPAADGTAFDCF